MADDFDVMEFDDDDLNFDDASFDVEMDAPTDDRNPIAVARDAVLNDVRNDMTDPARLTSIVRENLPSGYSSAVTSVDSAVTGTRELYNDAVSEVGPAVREMKRQTKRALPRMKNYMPASWYEKAEKFLTDEQESAAMSQQATDDTAIASSLASIFEQQNESERTEKLEDTANDAIEKKISETRHKEGTNLQVNVVNKLQQLIDFNNQINSKVSRQGLELQFRSYFTLRDLLEVTKRTSEDTVNHLSDIVKNTGLPDLLKHKPSENALQLLEDSIYGKRVEDAVGAMEPFVDKLKGKAKARYKSALETFKSGLTGASDALGGINDANEAMADVPGGGGVGVSDIAASLVSGNITERLSRKAGAGVRKLLDRDPTTFNSQLELAFSDVSGLASRAAGSNPGDVVKIGNMTVPKPLVNIVRWLSEGETGAVSEQIGQAVTNARGKETDAVSYDVMSRKSVVEIIPYYLREQLSQLDILNGGSGERHVYNPVKGRMDTMRSAVKDVRREAYNKDDEAGRLSSIKSTVENIDKDGSLSTLQRRKLAEIINTSAKDGNNFDPIELIQILEDEGSESSSAMAAQLREMLGIDGEGKVRDSKATYSKLTRISSEYGKIREGYTGSRQKVLGDYARSGSNEILEEAGILKDNGTRRGSELQYNAERARKYREQVLRTLFRDDLDETEIDGLLDRTDLGSSTPPTPSSPLDRVNNAVNRPRGLGSLTRSPVIPANGLDFGGGRPTRRNDPFNDLGWNPAERQRSLDASIRRIANYGQGANAMQQGYGEQQTNANLSLPEPSRGTSANYGQGANSLQQGYGNQTVGNFSAGPAERVRQSVANYGQGTNAMQQGYGEQSVTSRTSLPEASSGRPSHVLDTSALRDRSEATAITVRDGIISIHNGQEETGSISVDRRREEAQRESEEKDKEEQSPESVTILDHIKELISTNQQGFLDTVEAIMASSPNDEEIRDRYFGGLRSRMSARLKGVGKFLGGTFKTGMGIASVPLKMVTGLISGVRDAIRGEADIYVTGEGNIPALTVAKMQRGLYSYENGEVLSSLRSIEEPVYENGNQALTAAQLDKGIYTKSKFGKYAKGVGDKAKGFVRRQASRFFGSTVGAAYNTAKKGLSKVSDIAKKFGNRHLRRDLYLRGKLNLPVLTLAKLNAGEYFHPETNEILTSFSQITKGVKDRDGNWVLEPMNLSELVDINGKALKIRGLISSAFRIASKPTRAVINRVSKIAKYVNNKAMDRIKTDIYVYGVNSKGENALVPRLYHDALKRGEYYHQSEDGVIGMSLRSFAEIRGPIVDSSNKIKLTAEEIKAGLFDSAGKRLILAGTIGYIAKSAKNLVVTPVKKVFDMVKGTASWLFGGNETKGKESLMGKISGFFGGLRRPKIETMRVTTDIVYINGRNVLGGEGLKDGVKSARDIINRKTQEIKEKGRSIYSGNSVNPVSRITGISAMDGPATGIAGMSGDSISSRIGSKTLTSHAEAFNEREANKGIKGKLLDFKRNFKTPKVFDTFGKTFKFNWDAPDVVKKFKRLQRRIRIMGTRKQRKLLRQLEERMGKDGASEFVGPMPQSNLSKARGLLNSMGDSVQAYGEEFKRKGDERKFNKNFVGPKRKNANDPDGDGMRDGGYLEQAKDKAAAAKDFALKLFRRKQTKQGEEQISLLGKMLKTLKRTEKNTKDAGDGGGLGLGTLLAGAGAGGAAGGGIAAKLKSLFTGKKAAQQATQTAAKQAGKGALRTAATAVGRQVAFAAGRAALMAGAAVAGTATATVVGIAALVAGIGVGAYFGYKAYARRADVNAVERHRFISYGLNPDNQDEVVAIRYLEDKLEGEVTAKGFTDPITEIISDYAEDFGIEDDDDVGMRRFGEWIAGRFLPVFASWSLGAEKLGVDLDDVYDDLERDKYVALAKAVYFKKGDKVDPYAVMESPFEGRTLATRSQVRESLEALVDGDSDEKAKKGETKAPKSNIETGKGKDGKLTDKVTPKEVGDKQVKTQQAKSQQAKAAESRKMVGMRGNWTLDEFMDKSLNTAEDDQATRQLAADIAKVLDNSEGKTRKQVEAEVAAVKAKAGIPETKQAVTRESNDMRNVAIKRARKRKLQMQRNAFIKKAVANGTSTELPEHLATTSSIELARLSRQAELWKQQLPRGEVKAETPELPSEIESEARRRDLVQRQRERMVARARESSDSGKLSPEEYALQMQERQFAATLNMDNTLYHMYSVLEERLPLPEEEARMMEAQAAREKRRAEMNKRNKVNTEEKKRQPPAPIEVKPNVNPISFEKQRQQRY